MYIRIFMLLLLVVAMRQISFAQDPVVINAPGMQGALQFQHQVFGEIGVANYKIRSNNWWIFNAWGPNIGVGYNFKFRKNDFILAPRVGYEYFFYGCLLQAGLHLIDYTTLQGQSDLRLAPEFGVSLLVILNISYSYQFHIANDRLDPISGSCLNLKINLVGQFNKKMKGIRLNQMKFRKR